MTNYIVKMTENGTLTDRSEVQATTARNAVLETIGNTPPHAYGGVSFEVSEPNTSANERFFEMTYSGKLMLADKPLQHTLSL